MTLFLVCLLGPCVDAHEVRPAFLELTERAAGEFDVVWKVPALGGVPLAGEEPHALPADASAPTRAMPCGCPAPTAAQLARGVLAIHPTLPTDAEIVVPPRVERLQGAELRRWTIRVPRGLEGWDVRVHGLEATMADVLVRIALADGRVVSRLLRPDAPSFTFTAETAGPAAGGYFVLGVEHILFGIDHLLFVFALVLIVGSQASRLTGQTGFQPVAQAGRPRSLSGGTPDFRLLFATITAFTIAHSITLALATLGVVNVPSAPVEAVIALSIVFVAAEVVKSGAGFQPARPAGFQPAAHPERRQDACATDRLEACATLTSRAPWLVAGVFGLLHGFGFAGALSEVGLPQNDIPLALLFFNVGVEAGQLAFVAVVLVIIALLRRITFTLPRWAPLAPPYAIGALAMFWVIERTAAIW